MGMRRCLQMLKVNRHAMPEQPAEIELPQAPLCRRLPS